MNSNINGSKLDTDAELVAAALEGDLAAQSALYCRHVRMVRRTAARCAPPGEDPWDLVQEGFARAFSSLESLRQPNAFGQWVAGIVVLVARGARRKQAMATLNRASNGYDLVTPSPSSEAIADVYGELCRVQRSLARLPEQHQRVMLLRLEGLTIRQMAVTLNVSASSVKRWLRESERRLERAIAP
jgi:RNA polymerase sigma factor (sigma-70 family)